MPIAFTRDTKIAFLTKILDLLRVGLYPGITSIQREAIEMHMASMLSDPRNIGAEIQIATWPSGDMSLTIKTTYQTDKVILRQ